MSVCVCMSVVVFVCGCGCLHLCACVGGLVLLNFWQFLSSYGLLSLLKVLFFFLIALSPLLPHLPYMTLFCFCLFVLGHKNLENSVGTDWTLSLSITPRLKENTLNLCP